MEISQLIKSTGKYDLSIFSNESIDRIENSIFEKKGKLFLKCLKREKDIQVKPEEVFKLIFTKLYDEMESAEDRQAIEVLLRGAKKHNPTLTEKELLKTKVSSDGFTVHTLFNVWKKLVNQGKAQFANFSHQKLTSAQKEFVQKVFGIDFDERSVRVARTLNMIAGDGKTNVLHLNSLDYRRWDEKLKDRAIAWLNKQIELVEFQNV